MACRHCIICNNSISPLPSHDENDKDDERKENSKQNKLSQNNKAKFVLHGFCRYFRIILPLLPSLEWDLTREAVPFCPNCFLQVERLVKVNRKLEMLKEELGQIQGWVKSQITSISSTSPKNQLKGWSSEDPRVQTIRDIIVGPCIKLRRVSSLSPLTPVSTPVVVKLEPMVTHEAHQGQAYSHAVNIFDEDYDAQEDSSDFYPQDIPEQILDNVSNTNAPGIDIAREIESNVSDSDYMDIEENSDGDSDFEPEEEDPLEPVKKKKRKALKKCLVEDGSDSSGEQNQGNVRKTTPIGEERYLFGNDEYQIEFTGNNKDGYKCCQCTDGHVYPRRRNIRKHLTNHLTSPRYKCPVCEKELTSSYGLKSHLQLHNDSLFAVCEVCGKGCKGALALRSHIYANHRKDLVHCDVCGKTFKAQCTLNKHKREVHLKEKKAFCELCGKGFVSRYALKMHMHTTAHTPEKRFSCEECGQNFNTPAHRRRHIRQFHSPPAGDQDSEDEAAGDPNLRCKYCGLQYNRQNNLTRHLLQIHHINVKGVAWKTKAPRNVLEKVTPTTA